MLRTSPELLTPGGGRRTTVPGTVPAYRSGVCNGTLGELYQGPHWEAGVPHIAVVSLPVDKFSWCHFTAGPDGTGFDGSALDARPKAGRAVELFLDHYGLTMPTGRLAFHSELPVGKGMASSTADIVAALRCLFRLFALPYDQDAVTGILGRIERADSVFLDEFALYLSAGQRIVRPLGATVGLHACYIAEEGTVDTEAAGPALLAHYSRHRGAYRECLDGLLTAFGRNDAAAVAAAATRSATLSQGVLPKRTFDVLLDHRARLGADGLFVAHTGTVVGYLFQRRPDQRTRAELSEFFLSLGHQCHFSHVGWGHV
ncbi:GHMP family kinase ATP-binding protein [Streptomyces sp. NPDC000229]|uniref:GHMP family kinase ATP-binding protein n=1 Tax=Streptomyces sp. NPDC000229 TaxID=3154247 RepID=UPI0033332D78